MSEWESKANWKDRSWKYTPASATDVSRTIARIKREMKELQQKHEEDTAKKVTPIKAVAK